MNSRPILVFLIGSAAASGVLAVIGPRMPWPTWHPAIPLAVSCLIASVPATAEAYLLESWFRPGNVDAYGVFPVFFFVLVVTLAVSIPMGMTVAPWRPNPDIDGASAEPQPSDTPIPFLRRVPAHLQGDLLCIKTEDHYLRVPTAGGDELILTRLRDAPDELEGADGMQVHRSFWVARAAVTKIERTDGKTSLWLSNGLQVPVSRSHLPRLREGDG